MEELLAMLDKIESHLSRIADAADRKVKRISAKEKTNVKMRAITDEDKPTEKHFAYGQKLGVDVGREWGKFATYCKAHGKRYADFDAAFRNWLANEANFRKDTHAVR
jgi:hypothetical protein